MRRLLLLTLAAFEAFWTIVVLPGHVRGMLTMDGRPAACCAEATPTPKRPGCCDDGHAPKPSEPGPDRKAKCALCNNARGHVPAPVFVFDARPAGLSALCRLIEPTRLHRLLCEPTYDATAPPAALVC